MMDPQQRLLLESVADALLAPANAAQAVDRSTCGVFVGSSWEDYARIAAEALGVTTYSATGVAGSVVSGRLSYSFGFRGPAVTIDTACSSSLVGIHMAFNALILGQCSAAVGSGVNLILHPETFAIAQKAGMLTADGRCKTLSAAADGYGRAEACGTVLLQVTEVGQQSLGFIRGSALNQDGRSSSLTAPNGPSQQDVVKAALQQGAVMPAEMDALQMHGTGRLGAFMLPDQCVYQV